MIEIFEFDEVVFHDWWTNGSHINEIFEYF